jgi:hypothetical protein
MSFINQYWQAPLLAKIGRMRSSAVVLIVYPRESH